MRVQKNLGTETFISALIYNSEKLVTQNDQIN